MKKIQDSDIILPKKISSKIKNERYEIDSVGMSPSCIRIYSDKVLKVQKCSKESENEVQALQYLHKILPVPTLYAYDISDNNSFILMSKISGEMACSATYKKNLKIQCKLLSNALKKLWSVDISNCPIDQRLSNKLSQIKYDLDHGNIDISNADPSTFSENGFKNPSHLYQWLFENKPIENDLVFSHGDFCPENIFGIGEKVTGFIDLGRAGIADKWMDVALCYRYLKEIFDGKNLGYDEMMLFDELELKPDWEKINYYILLDELF